MQKISAWYLWLALSLGTTLVIESFFYRIIIKSLFHARNNILWVLLMAFAVAFGFWVLVMMDVFLNINKIR